MFEYASDETYSNDGTSGEKQKNTKGGSKGNPRVQSSQFDSENHVDAPLEMATWDVSRAHFYR